MRARVLLQELRRRGVALEADGDLLRVDAPVGVVTEELRRSLQENKRELMSLLERENDAFARLTAAGWTPRGRGGKAMWVSPNSGISYCEEAALVILEGLQATERYSSGQGV